MKNKNKETDYKEFFRDHSRHSYKKKIESAEQRKEKIKALKDLNDFFSDENKQLILW